MPTVQTRKSKTLGPRYYVRIRVNKVQTTVTFPTRAEAETFARDVENRGPARAYEDHMAELDDADVMTLDEWATRWLDSLTISPDSINNYRRDWERRWRPHLGDMPITRIGREDIAKALKTQTGAPKTVANAWGTLASMLKVAVLDGHLEKSPALGIKLPTFEHHEPKEHRYLTGEEFRQVIADTAERYRPLVWMLGGTGMRWGEATALLVGDVDLNAKTVRVTKAWKKDRAKRLTYVGATKTKKSRRTITLPTEVVEAIRPLIEGRKKTELLFTNTRGEYVRHQGFYYDHWLKRCTKSMDAPKPRLHDLRHSHVAWLIAAGVSLPVIQARLGHEKITTTIDTYGHLLPDLQVAAADAASRVLGSPKPLEITPPDSDGSA